MAVPTGPLREPWRTLLTEFLVDYYGFKKLLAPSSPMVCDPGLSVRRLDDVALFKHIAKPAPFPEGDRSFLERRIHEVARAGGKLWNGELARLTESKIAQGKLQLAFGRGKYHDYIACGEAMAAELQRAVWRASERGQRRVPASERRRRAFFSEVAEDLPLRRRLAPDLEGLRDLSRRVVKVGVVAATVDAETGSLLVHHRSRKVGEYPGLWSILPGGSVDPGARTVLSVLKAETLEELEMPGGRSVRPKRVVLAWDLLSCKLDFLLLLERPHDAGRLSPSWESREVRWVAPGEAERFQRTHPLTPHAAVGFEWARGLGLNRTE